MRDPRDKPFAAAMTKLIIETYPDLPNADARVISGVVDVLACCLAGALTSVMLKHGQESVEITFDFFVERMQRHFDDIMHKTQLLSEEKPEGPEGNN